MQCATLANCPSSSSLRASPLCPRPTGSTFTDVEEIASLTGQPLCIILTGLPGRGKTYLAHKLCRYINWIGIESTVFEVFEYLTKRLSSRSDLQRRILGDYFHNLDEDGREQLRFCIRNAVQDAVAYLRDTIESTVNVNSQPSTGCRGHRVAIIDDGCAITKEHRGFITRSLSRVVNNDQIIFFELVADNHTAAPFVMSKLKASPEFEGLSEKDAKLSYESRIEKYKAVYQQVDDCRSYIRVTNQTKVELVGISGYLPSRIVYWILNLNNRRQHNPIYFSRHGESEYNLEDRLGGDPSLSAKGRADAIQLTSYFSSLGLPTDQVEIWTSKLKRTTETAKGLERLGEVLLLRLILSN